MRYNRFVTARRPALPMLTALLLALLVGSPIGARSTDLRALIVGGGPEPEHNQVAIERNVHYVARLLPAGVPRISPFPQKFVQTPTLVVILDEGNVHSYRQLFLDGRGHPKNLEPLWMGDSIAKWDVQVEPDEIIWRRIVEGALPRTGEVSRNTRRIRAGEYRIQQPRKPCASVKSHQRK